MVEQGNGTSNGSQGSADTAIPHQDDHNLRTTQDGEDVVQGQVVQSTDAVATTTQVTLPVSVPPPVSIRGTTSLITNPTVYTHSTSYPLYPPVYPPQASVYPPPAQVYPPPPVPRAPTYPPHQAMYPPQPPVYPSSQYGTGSEHVAAYPQYPPPVYPPAYPPTYSQVYPPNFQAQHVTGYHQAGSVYTHHENEQVDDATLFNHVRRNNPPYFHGDPDPTRAERWIRDVETLFRGMVIPVRKWANLGKTLLMGAAREWLDMIERSRGDIQDWRQFTDLFLREYFPMARRSEKVNQFLNLRQEGMNIMEYQHKFYELGRYVPEVMNSESLMISRFLEGLGRSILLGLGGYKPTNMADLIDKALEYEKNRNKDQVVVGTKRTFVASQASRGAPQQTQRRAVAPPSTPVTQPTTLPQCPKCSRHHVGECRATSGGCYQCGSTSHFVKDCPQKKNAPTSNSKAPTGKIRPNAPTRVFAIDAAAYEPDEVVVSALRALGIYHSSYRRFTSDHNSHINTILWRFTRATA